MANNIQSWSKKNTGSVFNNACHVRVVHYFDTAEEDHEIELKNGQNGNTLMRIYALGNSSGVIPLPDDGIQFTNSLWLETDGGEDVGVDVVLST